MSTTQFAIKFTEGDRSGDAFLLDQPEITLGRSRSNHITLADSGLSRKHLMIRVQGSDVMIEDLGSTHGSFLNGKRLRGIVSLHAGDELILGAQTCQFVLAADAKKDPAVNLLPLQDLTVTDASAPTEIDEPEHDMTRFAAEGEIQETRYHALDEVAGRDDDDDEDQTRDLIDQHTRMLDAVELQGLKPGREEDTGSGKLMAGFVGIVALVALGAFLAFQMGKEKADENLLKHYPDEQYAFSLRYPSTWFKETGAGEHVISFEQVQEGITEAYLRVYVEEDPDFGLLGLTHGYEAYKETKAKMYEGIVFPRPPLKRVINGVPMLWYGFYTDHQQGKGVFTIVDNRLYDFETVSLRDSWVPLAKLFTVLLESVKLEDQEIVIDYPLPDQELRHLALGKPDELSQMALDELEVARVLMRRKNVRPENLFRAVETCQNAMQMASALGTRPPFFEKAAQRLAVATKAYRDEIEKTKFRIRVAEKENDWNAVYWEASKLMQLVPDKTDPDYQQGYKISKKYKRRIR